MALITRGFGGRRHEDSRLPPGQSQVTDWPVLSTGATPRVDTETWEFTIRTDGGGVHSWSWAEMMALPIENISTDIHCVTHWSRLGTNWRGVSLDRLFDGVDTKAEFVMAHSYGGYTTNIPLAELLGGRAWVAFEADGAPLAPAHGGPARLLVPGLYFWKSAKWVRGLTMQPTNDPGFWEQAGYNLHGDPWKEERYW